MEDLIYTLEQQAYIDRLAAIIEHELVKMAVVDYLGRRDGDGPVTVADPPHRRFGTRSESHVIIYDLKPLRWNARKRREDAANGR